MSFTEFVDRNDAGNIDFAERIADLEAAPPAPESFDATAALRRIVALCDAADDQPDGYECRFIATNLIRDAIEQP